jgi:hypothetical protein
MPAEMAGCTAADISLSPDHFISSSLSSIKVISMRLAKFSGRMVSTHSMHHACVSVHARMHEATDSLRPQ